MNWTRNYDVTTRRLRKAGGSPSPEDEGERSEQTGFEALEHDIRPFFETICKSLSGVVEETDKVPAWMEKLRRPPLSTEAKAIVEGRLLYDKTIELLADADRIRALSGQDFVKAIEPFRHVFRDRPRASASAEAELVAEWRSTRDAKRSRHRVRLRRS
jgi:hypothetical protein